MIVRFVVKVEGRDKNENIVPKAMHIIMLEVAGSDNLIIEYNDNGIVKEKVLI